MENPNPSRHLAVVIVQARMGSTRLPGKMMADLAGQPLIWHILQRALRVRPGLPVVLATTELARDDVLAEVAGKCGVPVVRGSEDDVLGRFLLVLADYPAEWVIRICGDSPLFDPGFLDHCLSVAQREKADVVKFAGNSASLFQGGEVVSARALRYSRQHAGADPLAVEHVTAWAMRHAEDIPHVLRAAYLEPEKGLMLDIKLSIDNPQDLQNLRALYEELQDSQAYVDLRQAAAWLAEKGWQSG